MSQIFAYGSLIWRPDFSYVKRRRAWLPGWFRRFWQASTDHRGTPTFPGRVVTLVAAPEAVCAGVLYDLDPMTADKTLAALDHREKGGYERIAATVRLEDGSHSENVIVYHGDHRNPHFVGPEDETHTASVIRRAVGPSGANLDYLLRLAHALNQLGENDLHVTRLARLAEVEPATN